MKNKLYDIFATYNNTFFKPVGHTGTKKETISMCREYRKELIDKDIKFLYDVYEFDDFSGSYLITQRNIDLKL